MLAFCDNTGEFLAATLRRGQRGQQHRRRPHHRPRRRARAAARPAPSRHPDPGPGRHRRLHAGVPRPHPRPARQAVSCEFSVGWAITEQGTGRDHRHPEARCGPTRSTPTAATVTAPGWPRSPACCPPRRWPATRRDPGDRAPGTPAPRRAADAFEEPTAGATPRSPPTPASGNSPTSTPATARTPGSRTASALATGECVGGAGWVKVARGTGGGPPLLVLVVDRVRIPDRHARGVRDAGDAVTTVGVSARSPSMGTARGRSGFSASRTSLRPVAALRKAAANPARRWRRGQQSRRPAQGVPGTRARTGRPQRRGRRAP